MTTLLDEAIAHVRELSPARQDAAARILLAVADQGSSSSQLTGEQIREVEQLRADLRSGKERFMTDEEVEAMWRRFGA